MSHHPDPKAFEQFVRRQTAALHAHILSLPAEQFKGNSMALVSAIEDFAKNSPVPMIFRGEKLNIARQALTSLSPKPKVIIEFGTFIGCSALAWGSILKDLNGADADIHVYTFEMDPEMVQVSRDFIRLAQVENVITVLEGAGSDSLKKLVAEGKIAEGGVDMVFIDHWEKFYLPDLQLCEELKVLHKGSLVIADNTDIPGAPDYVKYVKSGGSGEDGRPQYESVSHVAHPGKSESERKPNIVEISTVV